jgi:hypothetical protein
MVKAGLMATTRMETKVPASHFCWILEENISATDQARFKMAVFPVGTVSMTNYLPKIGDGANSL